LAVFNRSPWPRRVAHHPHSTISPVDARLLDRSPAGAFRTECSWTTPSLSQQREGCERSAVFLRRTVELQGRQLASLSLRLTRPLRCEAEVGASCGRRYSSGSLITAALPSSDCAPVLVLLIIIVVVWAWRHRVAYNEESGGRWAQPLAPPWVVPKPRSSSCRGTENEGLLETTKTHKIAALTTLMISRGVFSRDHFSRSPKFRVDFGLIT
jgi:hypothetical protein